MAGVKGTKSHKPRVMPERYAPGFLSTLDRRSMVAKHVKGQLIELQTALGGQDEITPQQRHLTERATYLHVRLQQLESEYLEGKGLDAGEYTQLANAQLGVLRLLGLARRTKQPKRLAELIAESTKK